jgi:methyl-accepting chemotaxis protein
MKISAKIFLSYATILFLLIVISYSGVSSINTMGDSFTKYRELALQTNATGQVLDSMMKQECSSKAISLINQKKQLQM